MNGSRGSSAASGSYGHISAGTINPMAHAHSALGPRLQQIQAHFLRASAGLLNPMTSQQCTAAGFSMGHVASASLGLNDMHANPNDLPLLTEIPADGGKQTSKVIYMLYLYLFLAKKGHINIIGHCNNYFTTYLFRDI